MKRMHILITALSMVLFSLSCSKEDNLRGSGNIISENRSVANFTEVHNPSSINIVIVEGSTQEVELSADDNVMSSIKTVVENGLLKIDLTKSNYTDITITASITIPNLDGLKNTGSGNMNVSGFDGLKSITIDNEGSGSIAMSGSGNILFITNSGSGSYNGFGFTVTSCSVANSGSGDCEINCTGELSGSNSGSGSILYKGTSTVDILNTGSGEVVDSN